MNNTFEHVLHDLTTLDKLQIGLICNVVVFVKQVGDITTNRRAYSVNNNRKTYKLRKCDLADPTKNSITLSIWDSYVDLFGLTTGRIHPGDIILIQRCVVKKFLNELELHNCHDSLFEVVYRNGVLYPGVFSSLSQISFIVEWACQKYSDIIHGNAAELLNNVKYMKVNDLQENMVANLIVKVKTIKTNPNENGELVLDVYQNQETSINIIIPPHFRNKFAAFIKKVELEHILYDIRHLHIQLKNHFNKLVAFVTADTTIKETNDNGKQNISLFPKLTDQDDQVLISEKSSFQIIARIVDAKFHFSVDQNHFTTKNITKLVQVTCLECGLEIHDTNDEICCKKCSKEKSKLCFQYCPFQMTLLDKEDKEYEVYLQDPCIQNLVGSIAAEMLLITSKRFHQEMDLRFLVSNFLNSLLIDPEQEFLAVIESPGCINFLNEKEIFDCKYELKSLFVRHPSLQLIFDLILNK